MTELILTVHRKILLIHGYCPVCEDEAGIFIAGA